MKSKDQQLLEEAYESIDEEFSIKPVGDIFDTYEEVGMSAEMGLQELIASTSQQILKEVPKEDQAEAHTAVLKLWSGILKDWRSLEGYQD